MPPLEDVHVEALRMLGGLPRAKVLDAPSGNGRMAAQLIGRGHQVVCGDIAPEEFAVQGVRCEKMDLNEPLPFPDNSFDAVVSIEGLEHVRRPYDLFREFGRVLKCGGVLVLSTPNILHVLSRLRFLTHGNYPSFKELYSPRRPQDWHGAAGHVTPFSYLQIVYACGWAGLRIEEVSVARLKRSRLVYLPLMAWIKLIWLLAGAEKRKQRHAPVVNGLKILLADLLLIKARKITPADAERKLPHGTDALPLSAAGGHRASPQ
jgi:SAM-dependent methyltransferase